MHAEQSGIIVWVMFSSPDEICARITIVLQRAQALAAASSAAAALEAEAKAAAAAAAAQQQQQMIDRQRWSEGEREEKDPEAARRTTVLEPANQPPRRVLS